MGEPAGMVEGPVERDRTAEVVDDQRERPGQTDALDEPAEAGGVILGPVAGVRRPIGEAEAKVIGGDDAGASAQTGNGMPPLEAPGRRAVDEDHRRPLAFVDIVQS